MPHDKVIRVHHTITRPIARPTCPGAIWASETGSGPRNGGLVKRSLHAVGVHALVAAIVLATFTLAGAGRWASPVLLAAEGSRTLAKATPESVGVSSERLRRLDAGLRRFVDEHRLAGVTTLLARRTLPVSATCSVRTTPSTAP